MNSVNPHVILTAITLKYINKALTCKDPYLPRIVGHFSKSSKVRRAQLVARDYYTFSISKNNPSVALSSHR